MGVVLKNRINALPSVLYSKYATSSLMNNDWMIATASRWSTQLWLTVPISSWQTPCHRRTDHDARRKDARVSYDKINSYVAEQDSLTSVLFGTWTKKPENSKYAVNQLICHECQHSSSSNNFLYKKLFIIRSLLYL